MEGVETIFFYEKRKFECVLLDSTDVCVDVCDSMSGTRSGIRLLLDEIPVGLPLRNDKEQVRMRRISHTL